MGEITWHFPQPLTSKKLSQEEEHQLFYDLAEQLSEIINREVKVNHGYYPIDFVAFENPDCARISILYSALDFDLHITLIKKRISWDVEEKEKIIVIDSISVKPRSQGLGSKLMKHFIQQMSNTSYNKVVLIFGCEDAGRFWRRMGFKQELKYMEEGSYSLVIPH
ncbi:hypothetical protein PMSD_17645 [Paenibacillus macquariensis subsp. defensor]|nr:hypothetical protein PMSD_17645 [Paenibacillus macquariensis subsp. defensor]